ALPVGVLPLAALVCCDAVSVRERVLTSAKKGEAIQKMAHTILLRWPHAARASLKAAAILARRGLQSSRCVNRTCLCFRRVRFPDRPFLRAARRSAAGWGNMHGNFARNGPPSGLDGSAPWRGT